MQTLQASRSLSGRAQARPAAGRRLRVSGALCRIWASPIITTERKGSKLCPDSHVERCLLPGRKSRLLAPVAPQMLPIAMHESA